MADILVTVTSIKPLATATVLRKTLTAAANAGDMVYIDNTGGAQPAKADASGTAQARGMVIADQKGSNAFSIGERVDVVVEGPVTGFSGMTQGADVFLSDANAGRSTQVKPATTAHYPFTVGYAQSDVTIYVAPQRTAPVAN